MTSDSHRQFVERFLRDQHRLYGYIATLVPARSDAEEIFQETSLLLWEKWGEFDQTRDLLPWACGIAHNVVRNFLRKKRPSTALSDPFLERVAETRLEMEEELVPRREALADCMQRLPEDQQTLVRQCYSETSRINKLAEQLGTTANSIYLKLRRIRAALLDCINRRLAREEGQ